MKRKLGWWFTFSPVIVGVLWLLVSLVFRILGVVGSDTVGIWDITKTFINRGLGILALISIPLCIVGIVFLSTAKSKVTKTFTIKEIVKFSRTSAKKNMSKFLLGFAIYLVLQLISSFFGYSAETGNISIVNVIISIVIYVAVMWLGLGYKNLSLRIVNEAKAKFSDVFVDFKKTIKYIGAFILVFFIIGAGFILLIVPGIIFSLKLSLVPYLILDKNMGPIEAIKTSWKMTKGFVGDIFILNILCGLINVLGFLVVLVGLLRTLPLFMIANAYIYKKILAAQKK